MNGLDEEIDAETAATHTAVRRYVTMRAVASEATAALWVAAALAALAFFW
jgi:hypothetical protein